MKLIKICLASFAILQVNQLLTSDPMSANTGAAKSSEALLPGKPLEHSPIDDRAGYPTLTAAAAASGKAGMHTKAATRSKSMPPVSELDASEKPTIYNGSLPDITTKHGEYRPKVYDRWNFPHTLEALKSDKPVEVRAIEKSSAEVWQNSGKFNDLDVAELAKMVNDKKIIINPDYLGDLHATCERAKEDEAQTIVDFLREHTRKLHLYKNGVVASLESYGRSNGTGSSSPIADYGMGPRFGDDEVATCQQVIAKVFKIARTKEDHLADAATSESAAGGSEHGFTKK